MNATAKTLVALAATISALALTATANAAPYEVRSCDAAGGAQNAWGPWTNHFQVTAYSVCPSLGDWGRGIIATRSGSSGSFRSIA